MLIGAGVVDEPTNSLRRRGQGLDELLPGTGNSAVAAITAVPQIGSHSVPGVRSGAAGLARAGWHLRGRAECPSFNTQRPQRRRLRNVDLSYDRVSRQDEILGVQGSCQHSTLKLTARLSALDARYLDAAVEQIAGVLERIHLTDDDIDWPIETKNELRSAALGILAHPAYALALLQQDAQQPLRLREPPEEEPSPVSPPAVDAGGEHPAAPGRRPPCCCGGHTCGTITVPLSKLRPTAQVIVHLNSADLIAHGQGNPRGSAWIEQAGHVTIETLTRMLRHSNVTVKPVVDLNELPTEDRYAPSAALREAVEYLFPVEAFPFATRSSQGLQQDHTSPWGTGPFSGKTELRNLAPLGVKVHNAKTARYWTTRQVRPGQLWWRSPLGYQYLRSAAGTTRLDDHHLYASVCRPGP